MHRSLGAAVAVFVFEIALGKQEVQGDGAGDQSVELGEGAVEDLWKFRGVRTVKSWAAM